MPLHPPCSSSPLGTLEIEVMEMEVGEGKEVREDMGEDMVEEEEEDILNLMEEVG